MSLKNNVIANYFGQVWSALIGLAFIPLYIHYLGVEAYGLIGLFALMQSWLTLLDMGFTPTLNREMARFAAGIHTSQSIRDLLRSLEIICFCLAALIGIVIWSSSGLLSADWLRVEKLPINVVGQAIAIMGWVAAFRFVEGIYRAAILGLQRQVFFNLVNASLATLRAVGAFTVLVWISPTIGAFFIWQGIVSIVSIVILSFATYKSLPEAPKPSKFSRQALIDIWRFAGGIMATTFLAILLTQIDKLILSKLISLEAFGYYTLAGTVVTIIGMMIAPITQAFYPRFTELAAKKEGHSELVHIYHFSSQLVAVLVGPVALMLIFFGKDLLILWTSNLELAGEVAPILSLLAAGTLLNGLMLIPYMLQLAHGWSGFAARVNLAAVFVLVPLILWVTPRYGAIGAAWVWLFLNIGYIVIGIHFMYRRLLPNEKWTWYWFDTFRPIGAATLVASFMSVIRPQDIGKFLEFTWLIFACLCVFGSSLAVTPKLRTMVANIIFRKIYSHV